MGGLGSPGRGVPVRAYSGEPRRAETLGTWAFPHVAQCPLSLPFSLFNLFITVLSLRHCPRSFSRGGEWEPLFLVVLRLLIAVASLVLEHSPLEQGFSRCDSQALEHRLSSCSTQAWDLLGPGIEPMSHALGGGFFTTEPLWKPSLALDYPLRTCPLTPSTCPSLLVPAVLRALLH